MLDLNYSKPALEISFKKRSERLNTKKNLMQFETVYGIIKSLENRERKCQSTFEKLFLIRICVCVCVYSQNLYLYILFICGLIQRVHMLIKATLRTADGVEK